MEEKNIEKFNPLISIIIPVYNGANYMREAIDSALAQTYKNIEVIVVNDGSTDETDQIAKSYGNKIRYFVKENGGVASALNFGLREMKGEYFSWLSHDDVYFPEKIEAQIDLMRKTGEFRSIFFSDWASIDGNNNIIQKNKLLQTHPDRMEYYLILEQAIYGCSLLIHRTIFEDVGLFPEGLISTQDYTLWLKMAEKYRFIRCPILLVYGRKHSEQGSNCLTHKDAVDNFFRIQIKRLTGARMTQLFPKDERLEACIKLIQMLNNRNLNDCSLIFYNQIKEIFSKSEQELLRMHVKIEDNISILDKNRNIIKMSQLTEKQFNPLVSVVIPVYNGANYMREAIDSALAQTYKNIEVIVVNDGSTDETDQIAKSYGNKIRYFKKENGGTSTALNLGIKNMKGSYFSWLSHDDMYYPNKVARQIQELSKLKDKNTIIMSDVDAINEKYEKMYKTNFIERINQYSPRKKSYIYPVIYNQTHGCTLLISKVCFDKVGLFNEKQLVAQDFEFFYRAFLKFPHKLISEILVTARDSSNRQGRRSKARGSSEYSDLFISIIEKLSDADIKLLAPDKLSFYHDMQDFFKAANYNQALEYINKKIVKNLQISSYDLIGNKFNGYDLHLQLRENAIDSKQLVLFKESDDINTYPYNFVAEGATKELLQQKIFLDADLIHLHLIHNIIDLNYLPIITRLKPTILSLHDPFFLGGHCVHHFDCKKWQTHCKDCPYLNEPFVLNNDCTALNFELKKQAIQNSQITAIVASKWMKNKVEQSPIWQGKKIYLLPFGVNQELFSAIDIDSAKRKLNISEKSITIMFRADPGSYKGLDIIKQALVRLKNLKIITLIAVGQKGLLKEFNGKFNIIEYGWIKDDKLLASLYQACDIFLMPSRQETFGMMAIEAMSCGKMVLSLDCDSSALPEVVNSPICGLAVSEKDFAKELQKLIDNPEEIIKRGKKSLEFAKENYSKDIYVKEIIKIYEEVMLNHHLDESSDLILQQLKANAIFEIKNDPKHTAKDRSFFCKKLSLLKHVLFLLFIKYKDIFPKTTRTAVRIKLLKLYAKFKS